MTREYILQNLEVMCPIIFIDNSGLRDHVMSTLQDSLLIPKPKFKVGDKVNRVLDDGTIIYTFKIDTVLYSPGKKRWFYLKDIYFYEEHLIQLVEEGVENV